MANRDSGAGLAPKQASGPPRYQTIADALIDDIASGRHPVGSMLPTELALCDRFQVSRFTVREALRQLEELGLVSRRRGAGTVVRAAHPTIGYTQTLRSVAELLQYPKEIELRVHERETVTADRALAQLLGCRVGDRWYRVGATRSIDGTKRPICWTDVYVIPEYMEAARSITSVRRPVYQILEETTGDTIASVKLELVAGTVPAQRAEPLAVAPGSPALVIIRRYTGRQRRVFEVSVSIHPADRFSYSIELHREWRPSSDPTEPD